MGGVVGLALRDVCMALLAKPCAWRCWPSPERDCLVRGVVGLAQRDVRGVVGLAQRDAHGVVGLAQRAA